MSVDKETAPTTNQVLIRAKPEDHDRWKQAAELSGKTMSDFMRDCANAATAELLDCTHPESARKTYPWSSVCLKCGVRLSG